MRLRTRYLLFAIIVALVTVLTSLCITSKNEYPSNEKAVFAALTNRTNGPVAYLEGREKLRLIGTNALPVLIEMLTAEDSAITKAKMKFNRAGVRIGGFVPASARRQHALRGFRLLGPIAAPAIPVLTNMIERGEAVDSAMNALSSIGDEAQPALERLLQHRDAKIRQRALYAIGQSIPHETFLTRVCLSSLDDPDPGVRITALDSFPVISRTPSNTLTRISRCFSDTNARVRLYATNLVSLIEKFERMYPPRNE